ncbi:hypothetical protein [Leptospira noguchii]|nr:hypothetical protein [Leptospira noguchii]
MWVVSHFNYEICERFAPIFLRRTHVKIHAKTLIENANRIE